MERADGPSGKFGDYAGECPLGRQRNVIDQCCWFRDWVAVLSHTAQMKPYCFLYVLHYLGFRVPGGDTSGEVGNVGASGCCRAKTTNRVTEAPPVTLDPLDNVAKLSGSLAIRGTPPSGPCAWLGSSAVLLRRCLVQYRRSQSRRLLPECCRGRREFPGGPVRSSLC